MRTNISPEHVRAFEALTSGDFRNFALFSCFVDGAPAAAIVAITSPPDGHPDYVITPLFVSVTPAMTIADHEGIPASGA